MDLLIIFGLGLAAFLWLAKFAWRGIYYLTDSSSFLGKPKEEQTAQ